MNPQPNPTQINMAFPVHVNSLDAWYNQILPNLNEKQKIVLEAIKQLGRTNLYELERYLNRSKNTFSGRISELKKKGLIKQVSRVKIGESTYSVYELNN